MTDPADSVLTVYRRHAHAWAAARSATSGERAWLERFSSLLDPDACVLDIGCGSGKPIARYLADKGHQVVGVDGSAEMIALFRMNLPGAVAELSDMRSLHLDAEFGGLIAWDSLFHLTPDEQRSMFPVLREHAEPGAALLFTSGPAAGEAIGALEGDPLYHASLGPDEYRSLLDENDFEVVGHVAEDPQCGFHTVWLARRRPISALQKSLKHR